MYTTSTYSRNWTKNQRQTEINEELRQRYPPYQPSSNLDILHIHYRSTVQTIEELITKAKISRRFFVDTESQRRRHEKGEPRKNGALIQIQMVSSMVESTVVLIEMCYLPDAGSIVYEKIEQLLGIIFNSNKEIITWGPIGQEFDTFRHFDILYLGAIRECDLQFIYSNQGQVYDTHPEMERREMTDGTSMEIDAPGDEIIIYADDDDDWIFDNIQPKQKLNPPVGLRTAMAEQFGKFLDKSYTNNEWNCGLDLELDTWKRPRFSKGRYDEETEKQERYNMVNYATHDCAAMAELYFKKFPERIQEYLTPPATPVATIAPVIRQNPYTEEIFISEPRITRTEEEERQWKKDRQKKKNEKYKQKKRENPNFDHRIWRPIYHKYDYRKIRAQLQEDQVYHSHQININREKNEVTINFVSDVQREEAKKKVTISYFGRANYIERWGQ